MQRFQIAGTRKTKLLKNRMVYLPALFTVIRPLDVKSYLMRCLVVRQNRKLGNPSGFLQHHQNAVPSWFIEYHIKLSGLTTSHAACGKQPENMKKTNKQACSCQARIKEAIKTEPSAGHDYVDEIIGLLRVAQGQRDSAEQRLLTSAGGRKPAASKTAEAKHVGIGDLLAFVEIRNLIGDPTGKLMQPEVVEVVRKLAHLKYCADQLNTIVEGVKNKRWAADGCRLKDTMEWCDFYCALSEANAVIRRGG